MNFGNYGFIPSILRHHHKIRANAKLLYSEITATIEQSGYCVKNNIYFSKVLSLSKTSISQLMNELRGYGFIKVIIENEENTNRFKKRYISLTPHEFSIGVMRKLESTHSEKSNGVDLNMPITSTSEEDTPLNAKQSILLENNISYIYTSDKKNKFSLHSGISEKQLAFLKEIVTYFYKTQSSRFPDVVKNWKTEKVFNESVNTIYHLITKEKIDYQTIKKVLHWALHDDFWHKHLLSVKPLKEKAGNGIIKFNNILHAYNLIERGR